MGGWGSDTPKHQKTSNNCGLATAPAQIMFRHDGMSLDGVQAQARKKKIAKAQIQLAELRAQTRGADLQSFSIGYQSGRVLESKIVPS